MATKLAANFKIVNKLFALFGMVAWLKKNNGRQEYGETQKVKNSLEKHGWLDNYPVPVAAITQEEITAIMMEREEEWKRLKDQVVSAKTAHHEAELAVFETMNVETVKDDKGNESKRLLTPLYSGNACFRRASVYIASQVERYLSNSPDYDHDIVAQIPVQVIEYETYADRLLHQQMENEVQNEGTLKVSQLEKLAITRRLYDAGCRENRIRILYSSSIGQKTFGICQANVNWPELNVYNRFFAKNFPDGENNPDWIPFGPIMGPDMVSFNNRFEADRKRKEGFRLSDDERAMNPITADEMDRYFRDKKAKTGPDGQSKKMMEKKELEAIAKNGGHPLKFMSAAVGSVLNNTQGNLAPLIEHKDSVNQVYDLIKDQGKGDLVDLVIDSTVKHESLMSDFALLLKQGKEKELRAALDTLLGKTAPAQPEVKVEPTPAPEVKVEPTPEVKLTQIPEIKGKKSNREKQTV